MLGEASCFRRSRNAFGCTLFGCVGLLLLAACDFGGEADTRDEGLPAAPKSPMRLLPLQPPGAPLDTLPPDQRVALILGLQAELKAHGYEPVSVDGVLWPDNIAAIRQYQRDADLVVDGQASKELLDHLKFAQPQIRKRE